MVTEHRAHGAVDVADGGIDLDGLAAFQSGCSLLDQLHVERLVEAVVLKRGLVERYARFGTGKHRGQVHTVRLPMLDCPARRQVLDVSHGFLDGPEAQFSKQFANLLRDEQEERLHKLRFAAKALPQFGVLRGDAHWARVQVTYAHHDATGNHEWCRGKAKLLCT